MTDDQMDESDGPEMDHEEVDESQPERGELVHPPQEPVRHAGHSALEAAASAALEMPGIPGRDEFLALAMQARILSMSAGAPAPVRNNPHLAFHIAMVGRDLGISPSAALELIDVIEGKTDRQTGEKSYRLSLSPQLINGQIRRLGLGSIRPVERSADLCVAAALAPDGEVMGYSEFTWEDARTAGLVGARCYPGEHVKETRQRRGGQGSYQTCGCNQGYITYPQRMMWWRAAGFCADDFFPEAGLGMYTPEALGSVVGPDGRPLDPADVELPDGYGPAQIEAPPEPAPVQIADGDELWSLQAAIYALPDEQRRMMAERWKDSRKLTVDKDGRRLSIRPHRLPEESLGTAQSMVRGFERIAERGDWNAADALEAIHTMTGTLLAPIVVPFATVPWLTREASESDPGPEVPDTPPEDSPGEPGGGCKAPGCTNGPSDVNADGYCPAHATF